MHVCNVIAPGNGEELFESMMSVQRELFDGAVPDDLVVLMTAYKNAKTRNLKKQILSLYAQRYPMTKLKKIHQPYGSLSTWEIKQARSHAKMHGPGTIPEIKTKHRVRLDMRKVDHFVEFINRPYFYQDVSYGNKVLTLDNGDRIEMPNVVRILTRSTMIEQYLEYCKEQCHEPLSRSSLFKILEVREASQRKSLQGLDNTAADGAAGVQTIETLVETLEKGGMEKQWCLRICQNLRDAKRYLKTDYRVHCQQHYSTCADHCRKFALSDPVDPELQHPCPHQHQSTCEQCQGLKDVLKEVRLAIEGSSWKPYSCEQREDVLYDFDRAQSDILLWKAHIHYMRVALSECPVQGTTASVCAMNETQKTLELHKIEGFSKYHNFKFEVKGIRAWKAYGVGLGKFIPYREVITEPQGPTGLIVHENFFPLKEARVYKRETNSENEQCNGLFSCSEPGCNMVFKKFSELENHLDVGEHSQVRGNSDTVYDKLRRDWAEKFRTVDKDEEIRSVPEAVVEEHHEKNKTGRFPECSDLQTGWVLHKPRNEAVRFPTEVKQNLTTKFDLGERTGIKSDPAKVAADVRTARNPDSSRMFERKHWLTKGQVQGFFSRLAASRRSKAHREALNEDVEAEQEEQERRATLEEVATHLGPKHPICYDSYCLCDLSHEKKLERFSVAMLKDMLKYFEIPFSSRDRKKILVGNLSEFLEGCDCNQSR
ncbi:unnamed protein product [Porites lobata]|uniref:C2H2-type domain-containing protein n=1 Tax=Porites lobata TaxID=104759 RepID=A0ABN8R1Y1_9CNID|nr:unnamed protein product [Porites lobata]